MTGREGIKCCADKSGYGFEKDQALSDPKISTKIVAQHNLA